MVGYVVAVRGLSNLWYQILSNNVANYVENINQYMTIIFDSVGFKAQSPGIQRQIGHQKTF